MDPRNILKTLVHFARNEYKDKQPKSVKLYRVKSKNILTRGILPSLQIKEIGLITFLIIADYGESLRIYSFSRQGKLLSGVNISPDFYASKKMENYLKLEFQFPKKNIQKMKNYGKS